MRFRGGKRINGRLYVRTRGGNWIALELLTQIEGDSKYERARMLFAV